MATSGSVDYNLTATTLVPEAYRLIGGLNLAETLDTNRSDQGLRVLNLMLKTWGTDERLWLKAEGSLALLASTASYALPLAHRIHSIRSRTSGLDTPLTQLTYEEYYDLSDKTSAGLPVNWFFDPSRAASTRTLYVWPVPTTAIAAATTLKYSYDRVIEDIDALGNDFDVPQEWLETVMYNLAARLILYTGILETSPNTAAFVKAEAERLLARLTAQDQEDGPVFMQPAFN